MLKRHTKRKIKGFFSLVIYFLLFTLAILGLFFFYRFISPIIKTGNFGRSDKIIKPIGAATTIAQLKQKLTSENIILDSLLVSSSSGVFIGRVREGPTVYFSDSQDAEWQVKFLGLILSRTTVDNRKPTLVDLTSVRPIVKF